MNSSNSQRSKKRKANICIECGRNDTCIDDLVQNIRVCTDCGVIQGDCSERTSGITFNDRAQMSVTDFYASPGSFVHKKHKIAQLNANRESNTKAQNRMRNLKKKLAGICERLELCQRIQDRALCLIFSSLENAKLPHIKKDELLAAVCIVISLREAGLHFTYREVSNGCHNVKKKEIGRKCKEYERILAKNDDAITMESCKFSKMVPRFTSLLQIEFLQQKKIRLLYSKINSKQELSTLNPLTRLATAIYIISGETKDNCKAVSLTCNVSTQTILRSAELIHKIIS